MRKVPQFVVLLVFCVLASKASAALVPITIDMTGAATIGDPSVQIGHRSGVGRGTYDTDTNTLSYSMAATWISSPFNYTLDHNEIVDVRTGMARSTITNCVNNIPEQVDSPCAGVSNDPYDFEFYLSEMSDNGSGVLMLDYYEEISIPGNENPVALNIKSTYTVSSVPVPAAVWLFGSALLTVVGLKRRY